MLLQLRDLIRELQQRRGHFKKNEMKFEIFLDKAAYIPGDIVSGRVLVWRNRQFATYGCRLELCGVEQSRQPVGSHTDKFVVTSNQVFGVGCHARARPTQTHA